MTKLFFLSLLLLISLPIVLASSVIVSDGVLFNTNTTYYIVTQNTTLDSLVVSSGYIGFNNHEMRFSANNSVNVQIIDFLGYKYIITVNGSPQTVTVNITNTGYSWAFYDDFWNEQLSDGYWQVFITNENKVLSLLNKVFTLLVCPDTSFAALMFIGILFFYLLLVLAAIVMRMDGVGAFVSLAFMVYALFTTACYSIFGYVMAAIGIGFLLFFVFRR